MNRKLQKQVEKKLQELLFNYVDSYEGEDVPFIPYDSDYKTSEPLSGLGPLPVGEQNQDAQVAIKLPPKKKRKFLEEPPVSGKIHNIKVVKPKSLNNKQLLTDVEEQANPEEEEQDPNAGMDPSMAGGDPNAMGMDPNAAGGMGMGMGMGMEQPKTAQEIGRIFELKKIYARLLAIESFLAFSSDIVLQKLRVYVAKSVELFETLISNIDSFKEEVDEIIVTFYEFLDQVYAILKSYYEKKKRESNKEE